MTRRGYSRRRFLAACAAATTGIGLPWGRRAAGADAPARSPASRLRRGARAGRVVILGFDGLDHGLVTGWMARGLLPNFRRLAADGGFWPLATTTPAESPVAWAAFSVCAGPGQTGIFDFLSKAAGTYEPQLALAHETREPFYSSPWLRGGLPTGAGAVVGGAAYGLSRVARVSSRRALLAALPLGAAALAGGLYASLGVLPDELPVPVCDRLGTDFWTLAGRAGVPSAILEPRCVFPPRRCLGVGCSAAWASPTSASRGAPARSSTPRPRARRTPRWAAN